MTVALSLVSDDAWTVFCQGPAGCCLTVVSLTPWGLFLLSSEAAVLAPVAWLLPIALCDQSPVLSGAHSAAPRGRLGFPMEGLSPSEALLHKVPWAAHLPPSIGLRLLSWFPTRIDSEAGRGVRLQ